MRAMSHAGCVEWLNGYDWTNECNSGWMDEFVDRWDGVRTTGPAVLLIDYNCAQCLYTLPCKV